MADVVRFCRSINEVTYTAGPETVRKAILCWLEENSGASFLPETELRHCEGGSIAVTTRFDTRLSPDIKP